LVLVLLFFDFFLAAITIFLLSSTDVDDGARIVVREQAIKSDGRPRV
jgi:hypothetical protein